MKKYNVEGQTVEDTAEATGVDVNALPSPADVGPDRVDSSHIANQPVKFDKNTTAWSVPSGDGFLCMFYMSDTNPLRSELPLNSESLDEFGDE